MMSEDEAVRALRGDDPAAAEAAAAALWEMWVASGSPETDKLLQRGVEAMERGDLLAAEALFTDLIRRAPDFAEGWNKRATVRYLGGNHAAAIADCEQTLARKPHHFGALSGQGLCHMALGQHREAAGLFRRTLAVYPHLDAARRNLAAALGEVVKRNGHVR
jgi:tetratricopeptide (TPR) repeat protein